MGTRGLLALDPSWHGKGAINKCRMWTYGATCPNPAYEPCGKKLKALRTCFRKVQSMYSSAFFMSILSINLGEIFLLPVHLMSSWHIVMLYISNQSITLWRMKADWLASTNPSITLWRRFCVPVPCLDKTDSHSFIGLLLAWQNRNCTRWSYLSWAQWAIRSSHHNRHISFWFSTW